MYLFLFKLLSVLKAINAFPPENQYIRIMGRKRMYQSKQEWPAAQGGCSWNPSCRPPRRRLRGARGLQMPEGEGGERACRGWRLPAGVPSSAGRGRAATPVAKSSAHRPAAPAPPGYGLQASAGGRVAELQGAPCRWRPALPRTGPSRSQPAARRPQGGRRQRPQGRRQARRGSLWHLCGSVF